MKLKALWKDTFREIGNSKTRFLSIFAIILLGVAFFAGLSATGPVMISTVDNYVTDQRLGDVHMFSTMGLDETDEELVESFENTTADFLYSMDVVFEESGASSRVYGHANDSHSLNQYIIDEGRLPEETGEIALDNISNYREEYSIGDTIQIEEGTSDEFEDSFQQTTFEIVGFVNNPLFIESVNRGNTQVGTGSLDGFSVILEEDFEMDVYTDAFVLFDESAELEAYSEEYDAFVENRVEDIEESVAHRPSERYNDLREEIEEEIEEGYQEIEDARQELEEAEEELEDARTDLDEGYEEYEEGLAELENQEAEAREEIDSQRSQLLEAQNELNDTREQLEAGRSDIISGLEEINSQEQQISTGLDQINAAENELEEELQPFRNELEEARQELESGEQELNERQAQLDQARQSLEDGIAGEAELEAALEEVDLQRTELIDMQNQMSSARDIINNLPVEDPELVEEMIRENNPDLLSVLENIPGETISDQLANAEAEIASGLEELNATESELEAQLTQVSGNLEAGRAEIESGQALLNEAREELNEGYAEYEQGLAELETREAQAREEIEAQRNQLLQAQTEIDTARNELETNLTNIDSGLDEINEQEQLITDGLEEINQAETELEAELASGRAELEEARIELEEADQELTEAEESFEEERVSAESDIEEGLADLEEAEEELEDLEEPDYFVEDRSSFAGYSEFGENAERINAIARIFPVFFFLLAALISLTTMTRMVDEGRNQIGTLKALGYGNASIATKYFTYAFIATVTGTILGLFIGYWLFPSVIMNAYGSMYTLPPANTQFYWNYATISMVGALLATGLSTLISVRLSLRSNAATLLRPKAPKKGKRIFLEYIPFIWKRFTFTQKVASRNLFRYKRRMLMTIFGIAGGTALLLTGYGLSDSIANIGDIQFGEINQYQALVSENPEAPEEQLGAFEDTLSEIDDIEDEFQVGQENATVERNGETRDANLFIPSDADEMDEYILLRDLDNESVIHDLPEEGTIVTDKLADLLDVSVGDSIQLTQEEDEVFEVEVTAIVEQYLDHYVYLSPEAYTHATNEEAEFNMRLLKYDDESVDEDELGEVITNEEAVQGIVLTSDIHEGFQDSMDSLDVVTVVLIVSAASLAFVVLYNLTNINVSERIRELSTIKVLGFFDKEVTMYVYRENLVLTILGILAGFVLGFFMHGFVIQTAEVDMMRFAREIMPTSYLYSFLLMFFFSSLVMIVMHFKLKRIDMVEALKTVD